MKYLEQQELKEGRRYNKIELKFTRESFANHIPLETPVDQIKNLSDAKLVAYYHGYKITPKGKELILES